jgi:ATP-binding cassette subfamily F protein uup
MSVVTVRGLAKAHGLKQVFTDLSFGIDDRDRIGIIGVNGCGKSTLLRILAGGDQADGGTIEMRQGLRVEFLSQNPPFNENHTVLEHIFFTDSDLAKTVREYEAVTRQLSTRPDDGQLLRRLDDLSRAMDALGAWEYETRAQTVLSKLGVSDVTAKMGELSGGYRKRVSLARVLLDESDLLILDEPTNHLDADTVAWLEEYLQKYSGAVVVVTHDRYFLDRVTNRIFEIDHGELREYEGNYEYYLEHKAQIEAEMAAHEAKRKNILRKELEWLRRGAKARRTKQKAKVQRVQAMREMSFARPKEEIRFGAGARRLGTKVVEMKNLSKSFGERKIISDFTYTIERGQRLGVIGANGVGKTTLVNIMTGRLKPDGGTIRVGETVVFGYYDQESSEMNPAERAIDYVKRKGGELIKGLDGNILTASAALEQFMFTSQMMLSPIENLSGGERRRLYLVRVLMADPNFLVLDEPTNDLDIATLESLEDFLDGFGGCLVVISHDRYFLDRTVDQLISFEGSGEIRTIPGNYSLYSQIREDEEAEAKLQREEARERETKKKKPVAAAGASDKPKKLTYGEQLELKKIEEAMPKMEVELKTIEQQMITVATDYVKLTELSNQHAKKKNEIDAAMNRWTELAERME